MNRSIGTEHNLCRTDGIMNYHQIQRFSDEHVRSLFGLNKGQLGELMPVVLPLCYERRLDQLRSRPDRKRAPGAGRKRKLSPFREVLMTLIYLRHNIPHVLCGHMFGVSADVSEDTFRT